MTSCSTIKRVSNVWRGQPRPDAPSAPAPSRAASRGSRPGPPALSRSTRASASDADAWCCWTTVTRSRQAPNADRARARSRWRSRFDATQETETRPVPLRRWASSNGISPVQTRIRGMSGRSRSRQISLRNPLNVCAFIGVASIAAHLIQKRCRIVDDAIQETIERPRQWGVVASIVIRVVDSAAEQEEEIARERRLPKCEPVLLECECLVVAATAFAKVRLELPSCRLPFLNWE